MICSHEGYNEAQIDDYIEHRKDIPLRRMSHGYNINDVVEDNPSTGSFYLAEDSCCVWWFDPRNNNGIANGRYDYRWFCFRTEDGKYHKFDYIIRITKNENRKKFLYIIIKMSPEDSIPLGWNSKGSNISKIKYYQLTN